MNERKSVDFEQGWEFFQMALTKQKNILEGLPEPPFSSEDIMMLYTTIYNMCSQRAPYDYSQQLYYKYRETLEEYINSTVLPSLRGQYNIELMLREFVKMWENHKAMVRWLAGFFHYLDRYFIPRRSVPSLHEVGLSCFRDLVYQEYKGKARDAVLSLIDQERDGELIDRALLKNVIGIYLEMCMGVDNYYENDFESAMLKDTAVYYSKKSSSWILEDSFPDYMLKVEECLKREKERVSCYLHFSSEPKLLERVRDELLVVHASQLIAKEHCGYDKVEDLITGLNYLNF